MPNDVRQLNVHQRSEHLPTVASASTGGLERADITLACLVGLATFGVYLATIYPGLLDIGDATKFAFVGKVLGVPHAPGYPLYVLVSYVFSHLPFGTLAYRMNVLSAALGAVAAALGYLLARRLGCGRAVAASTALALGFGQAFWAKALYAKAYTLQATLVSAGILALLAWHDRRRDTDLYWAVAIFALSLGNHLTVVALLPALVLFPFLVDARTALRPKTIAIVLVMVAIGLSQYTLILVRTWQHAPYLEARASNLRELWAVMTARRFAHGIGAYSVSSLMSTRVPVIAGLITTEFGLLGLALCAVGFSVMALREPRRALLFGLGALGIASLTANMSSEEDQGFLLSVFVLLWPVVGVGLQSIVNLLTRAPRSLTLVATVLAASALPVVQLTANYKLNDHHAETFETDYFNALFASLPNKSAIVDDEYRINMLVLYKLLGEGAAAGRDLRLVPVNKSSVNDLHQRGYEIFAFQSGRTELAQFGFNFEPFPLLGTGAPADVLRRRDVFRLMSAPVCLDIGNQDWVDIAEVPQPMGRMNVRIDNYRAFDADLVVYSGSTERHVPAVLAPQGRGLPSMTVAIFEQRTPEGRAKLATRLLSERVDLPAPVRGAPFVTRTEVRVNDGGAYSSFALDLGGPTSGALARAHVDQDTPKRASLCSHPLADAKLLPADQLRARVSPDATNVEFDNGWYPTERRADGFSYRWTTDRAVLLVPIDHPQRLGVEIQAEPLNYLGRTDGGITLVVNGHRLPEQPLPPGRTTLSWDVPADAWRAGLNELALEVRGATRPALAGLSGDKRLLGVSVSQLDFIMSTARTPH